jgi:hypothetical protein
MTKPTFSTLNRRSFLATSAAAIGTGAVAQTENTTEIESDISQTVIRNVLSFRTLDWQPYFNNLNGGAILVDIQSRALHYWNSDQTVYKLYPTSVPLTADLTRKGRTEVVRKEAGARRRQCSRETPNGLNLLALARITRLERMHSICLGPTNGFMEPTTRAKSDVVHLTAALASIMSTFPNSSE